MIELQYNNDLTRDQWLFNRGKSVGASEACAIVYGSKWDSNIRLYYEKISGIKKDIQSLITYRGHKSENIIDSMYPYYKDSDESIYLNEEKGLIIRPIENRNVSGTNSKFPHLKATPDRFRTDVLACAEYKSTQSYVLSAYKDNLPLENVVQCIVQVNVFELDFCDLFYFIDGRKCELHTIKRKEWKKQWEKICTLSLDFWQRVEKAKILYNQMYNAKHEYNMKLANELEAEIVNLEPPVQHTEAYCKFLNDKKIDRNKLGGRPANEIEKAAAKKYFFTDQKIKKLEQELLASEIDLKNSMRDDQIIHMDKNGQVEWIQYENRRIFRVKYK